MAAFLSELRDADSEVEEINFVAQIDELNKDSDGYENETEEVKPIRKQRSYIKDKHLQKVL